MFPNPSALRAWFFGFQFHFGGVGRAETFTTSAKRKALYDFGDLVLPKVTVLPLGRV
jgi:hypothetical protein